MPARSNQSALRKKYFQLTDVQRSLVQVFALLYEPTSRKKAGECWNAAISYPNDEVRSLNPQQFSQQVAQLIKLGVLVQPRGAGVKCAAALLEIAVRDAITDENFEPIAAAIADTFPLTSTYYSGLATFRSEGAFIRALRIAFYREDLSEVDRVFDMQRHAYWRPSVPAAEIFSTVLLDILTNPFDPDWFSTLSENLFLLGFHLILQDSLKRCIPADDAFELLEDFYHAEELFTELKLLYAEQMWLRGYLADADAILSTLTTVASSDKSRYEALLGAIAFLHGRTPDALEHYRSALRAVGKSKTAQAKWFDQPAAALFLLALLDEGTPAAQQEAAQHLLFLKQRQGHWLQESGSLLLKVLRSQQGNLTQSLANAQELESYTLTAVGIPAILEAYSLFWLGVENLAQWLPNELQRLIGQALKADYGWIALELAELIVSYQPDSAYTEVVEGLREQADSLPLIDIIERKEAWERSLEGLTQLTTAKAKTAAPVAAQSTSRLAWRLRYRSQKDWMLTPLEQKLSVKGGWTKGKNIALKRLHSKSSQPEYLTEQDRKICAHIQLEYNNSRYYSSSPTYFFTDQALLALVDHPLVFLEESPDIRVDVVGAEPELRVKRLGRDRLRLELHPPLDGGAILTLKETPTRLKVISVGADHRRIAEFLGPTSQLEVPAAAEARVLEAIASVASLVTVQSDIGGGVEAEEVPADETPRVHLLPAGEGLKMSLFAHPFPEGGGYYPLGEGGSTVIADIEGKRLQTQRNLKAEKKKGKAIVTACPVLEDYATAAGEWMIEEPEDCLNLLMQLQELGDRIAIEWPEGEKFKVSRQLGLNDFNFEIRAQQDWFAASGEVKVSDDQVVDIQRLMALLENSSGQFVQLSDGEFLALTEEFRQRLKTLSRLSQPQGKDLKIHGLAALALDDMVDDVEQLKVDAAWRSHIERIKAARSIEPTVPEGVQATLRDYQQDGFVWLARLANWGVGACLADDMGLGKTLQGLAAILSRYQSQTAETNESRPTLVIAPTSVCLNWASEAERFTPSLQVHSIGSVGVGDRQALLDKLGAYDLLVCSYGLLQQEDMAAMLAATTWQTIVLDEAQAIKNAATKRSQAVMALQADFKIIMTGTPIENHLGELWNLFRFINPGLLGSLDRFNQRFAYPIERDKDSHARETLRRLIQPFILRRTKSQVLKELPSRTEITLPIELSGEEMAFYEALRREAVEKLADSEAEAGHKHLQVLAEIMRLRRACCNPSLVNSELSIPSAKLEQFGNLVTELLENNHKALVFSQFVDHLKILRDYLETHQVSYQYLDGSTPAKKRQQGVEAFQQGEGDIFLISLKAGGTGLNLTAADYVIHMDPWWNPAVEDQASDRAHRIGQQRPVTIYRLVAKGTIEDKIVALHKNKRDLADSLLTGTDVSGKISTDELLSLIQQ